MAQIIEGAPPPYLEMCSRAEATLGAVETMLAARFDLDRYGDELAQRLEAGGVQSPVDMAQFERPRQFVGFPPEFQPHFYKTSATDSQGGIEPTPLECIVLPGGRHVMDKREDLHEGVWAFKARGGLSAVLDAVAANPNVRIFTAASTGNHARGVLAAVNMLNRCLVESEIVRTNKFGEVHPDDASNLFQALIYCTSKIDTEKREALETGGAKLIDHFDRLEDATPAAHEAADRDATGKTAFIHPFNVENVITAQGSLSLELLLQLAADGVDLRSVPLRMRVAVGGGGMYTGQQAVFRWAIDKGLLHPDSQIIAVEAENNDSANREINGHPPLTEWSLDGLAGGIATLKAGDLNVPVVHVYSPGGVRVTDKKYMILGAELLAKAHNGILPEFAGALSIASLLQDDDTHGRQIEALHVTITCGGNSSARVVHEAVQKVKNHQETRVASAAHYVSTRILPTLAYQINARPLYPLEVASHAF